MNASSKTCTGCQHELPLEDFQRDCRGKYGRVSRCRICVSARQGHKHIPRSNVEGMKVCTTCLRELTLEMFNKARRGKLGRCADCKDCQRTYRQENAERIEQYQAVYRNSRLEELRSQYRLYYAANADSIKHRVSEYAKTHPDVRHRASRNFHRNHPDRSRRNVILRRARIRNAEGVFSTADISRLLESQEKRCYWCSEPLQGSYHVDHVIPLSRGGSNWADNLVIACPACNWSKADKMPYAEWIPPKPLA